MMPHLSGTAVCPEALEAAAPPSCRSDTVRPVVALGSRLPSLDGWRALSILVVLGSHCKDAAGFPMAHLPFFGHAFDGHLGVRFFFVISGFLITWLMLTEEKNTGTVNLRSFYIRRALRILPVYLVYLAVIAVLQYLTPFHQSAAGWAGNLTFTTNYLHMTHVSDHLWSLAVEEQFYLLWPAAFVFLRPQRSLRRCVVIAGVMVGIAFLSRFILAQADEQSRLLQRLFHQWSFFNNADSLAVGSLAAIMLARRQDAFARHARAVWVVAAGLALLGVPVALRYLTAEDLPPVLHGLVWTLDVCAGRTLQSAGFALLMVQSVLLPAAGFYRLLNHRALVQIGVLSYSIYIWQQLFCTHPSDLGMQNVWWMSYPLWLLPVAAAAVISYYGLERPLLQLRHRFR